MTTRNLNKDILFGVAIGDALGVPVEFECRQTLQQNPVAGMRAFGTHHQPAGTFSDDSSLSFCLAEAIAEGFSLHGIARNFIAWQDDNYWTAHGEVFDVGIATRQAISRLRNGVEPHLSGGMEEYDNGNGSLMRILPLLSHVRNKTMKERFDICKQVSSITHAHVRSVIACFYYLEFALQLAEGRDKFAIYDNLQKIIPSHLAEYAISNAEIGLFDRLFNGAIQEQPPENIHSSGYVLHTLEASIWCILRTDSYREAVLNAVNLGEDTDTTAAVTGGLAGLLYGCAGIPQEWMEQVARRADIEGLAERMGQWYVV